MNALTWEEIVADRSLRNLPYKIETNRYNKIIMTPASAWRGNCEYEVGQLLGQLMPGGKVIRQCFARRFRSRSLWAKPKSGNG